MSKRYLLTGISLCMFLAFSAVVVRGKAPDELAAFVERTVADLSAPPLSILQFKSPKIDGIEDLGKVTATDRYLCWLKNDPNRVGYVAVARSGASFHVIAFSATVSPSGYLLKHLQPARLPQGPLDFSHGSQFSFVEGVPLVAVAKMSFGGTESIEISETSCCVASVLGYLQKEKKIYLLGPNVMADSEYGRRFAEDPATAQLPGDPNWRSFDEECRQAVTREPGDETRRPLQQYRTIKPILTRRLLDPANARERAELLQQERNVIANLTVARDATGLLTEGMKGAVLLQENYLGRGIPNAEQSLALFFRTRGRIADIHVTPLQEVSGNTLPAVLMGPDGIAGVVLGFVSIDGERFATMYFPGTGTPVRTTLAEKLRSHRLEKGMPANEPNYEATEDFQKALQEAKAEEECVRKMYAAKGLPDPLPKESLEQRLRQSAERARALHERMPVVEDRTSTFPGSLDSGLHVVRCSYLASWHILSIGKIEVGENWRNDRAGH